MLPYFCAGYPTARRLRELVWDAADAGATAIELGIPFSDPVADGPVLQAVMHDALQRGTTVRKALAFVRDLRREGFALPILGMTYANLIHAPGYSAAARAWARAGLDGAIVPDLPPEEAGPARAAFRTQGLAWSTFASPNSPPSRLRHALRTADAFVYLVAVYGTTGARHGVEPETRALLARARAVRGASGRPPLCVGFGISRPSDVRALRRAGADGVIVGSALARRIQGGSSIRSYIGTLVRAGKFSDAPPRY